MAIDYLYLKMYKKIGQSIPGLFLLANSLSWFSLTMLAIGDVAHGHPIVEILLIASAYFGSLIAAAFIGSLLPNRTINNRIFLLTWVFLGVISCLIFSLWSATDLFAIILRSLLLGLSAGVGIPACFSFFSNLTKTENRGKVGAVLFFTIQLLTAIVLFSASSIILEQQFQILAFWRLLAIFAIIFYKPIAQKTDLVKTSYISIIKERTFLLYFLPWFLFTLINFIEAPIIETSFGDLYTTSVITTTIISSISAIFVGILCDRKGRKIASILGFVLLGLGYAFLSFLGGPAKPIAQYLYILCDGIAWGALFVCFVFVIWGDLSEGKIRQKYYFIGSIPFLLSGLIEILIRSFISSVDVTAAFSLASFFLFLAIVPLLFAAETLPEKALKERDLKSYVEKAQKMVSKETKKKQKKEEKTKETENEESEKEDNSKEYEEAKKLAEKYY